MNSTIMKPDDLRLALRNGRRVAPMYIDEALVDRMVAEIERDRIALRSDGDENAQLNKLTQITYPFLRDDIREKLTSTAIFVLPYAPCLAFVQISDQTGQGQIVISEGMIALVSAGIKDAWLQKLIPSHLETKPVGRLGQPLQLVLNATTTLLRYHFYRYGKPLPNYYGVLDQEARRNIAIALSGALTFMLLHELGHLALGHLNRETTRLAHYDMVFAQDLTDYQLQEAEADQYAMDALKPEAIDLGPYWMSQSLAYFIQFELLSGTVDHEHPLAINRNYFAERLRVQRGQSLEPVSQKLGERFSEITQTQPPGRDGLLIDTPWRDCVMALSEVVNVLGHEGIDLRPLLEGLSLDPSPTD